MLDQFQIPVQVPNKFEHLERLRPSPSRATRGYDDPHRQQRDGPESILRVGGSVFGKATKVAIIIF